MKGKIRNEEKKEISEVGEKGIGSAREKMGWQKTRIMSKQDKSMGGEDRTW